MRILVIILSISMPLILSAQDGSKLFEKSNHWGGYGGFSLNMNPPSKLSISGEGAWIMGNLYFGGHGGSLDYGIIVSDQNQRTYDFKNDQGGLLVGYLSNNSSRLGLYGEARIYFGDLKMRTELTDNTYEELSESVLGFEPRLGITYNPVSYLQLRVFTGYNYTGSFDLVGTDESYTNGLICGIGVYFGFFHN